MPASTELTMTELKNILRSLPYAEVEDLICTLYRENKEVHRTLNARFNNQAFAPKLLEDFKKELARYIPLDFRPLSMRESKKALASYRKAAGDSATRLELLLSFVERCVLFTKTFGDIGDSFYTSAAEAFADFVDELNAQDDDQIFQTMLPRINSIVQQTSHIGWGFGDELSELSASILWRDDNEESEKEET